MIKSFHEVSETESRNLPPLCCPLACLSRLPADRYLSSLPSLASCTEILHFVQNDGSGRKAPQCVASSPAPMTPIQHHLPVISTGVEKSHASMVQAALRQEISRLRASIESKYICPPLRHAAPLEMTDATGCTIVISEAAKK